MAEPPCHVTAKHKNIVKEAAIFPEQINCWGRGHTEGPMPFLLSYFKASVVKRSLFYMAYILF